MKKFIFSFILISLFFVGCDPIDNTGDKMSLLPIAVDSKNCPVCPDPIVCPPTKTFVTTIICEEAGYENSIITIFKVILDKTILGGTGVIYIGKVNHETNSFIIDTRQHNFCYCYVKMVGDKLIYNKGYGDTEIADADWKEVK